MRIHRYKCEDCGSIFTEPKEHTWSEDLSGEGWGWCTFTDLLCPDCGCDRIDDYMEDDDAAEDSI